MSRLRVIFEVEAPDTDDRDAESIARALWDATVVGADDPSVSDLRIIAASAYHLSDVTA